MKIIKDGGYGVRVRAGEVELEQRDELLYVWILCERLYEDIDIVLS